MCVVWCGVVCVLCDNVLVREGDGEVVDVGLGSAVDAEQGGGDAAGERRQVDDRTLAAIWSEQRLDHYLYRDAYIRACTQADGH
jgi:hypothetical protein